MKKRLIGMAMAAVLAMTALTGCGTAEDTSSLDSLTFTYVTSPLNLPSIVEKEEGIFTKAFMQKSPPAQTRHRHWQPEMCRCCMPLAQPLSFFLPQMMQISRC